MEDETRFVNTGFEEISNFIEFVPTDFSLSYVKEFPAHYKIAGFSIYRDLDLYVTNRETTDLLDAFGAIGGVLEFLKIIGGFLVSIYTASASYRYAWASLYYNRKREELTLEELPITRQEM